MAIQKHKYELSIWKEGLNINGKVESNKQQIIGADDMTHLGRATSVLFKKLLNGTHTLTFQMPLRYFDSEKGDYVQNELIENIFNEQKIKLHFKNKWYEMVVKGTQDTKNHHTIIRSFTCSDGYIDELSRTGYSILLDPETNNSVNEIHNFMEDILEDSLWQYNPQWNWGDFTEFKKERFYKIPLSIFGGSITAYKLNLDIDDSCFDDGDKKEIINTENNKKRRLQYGDDLAGQQDMYWNQQDKINSSLYITKKEIKGDYIYIPLSDLTLISKNLYDNLDSAAQSIETYYDFNLKQYAMQPNFNNPKDIIQFLYLPNDSTYKLDETDVLIDYEHTYILTVDSFNQQNQSDSKVYYRNTDKTIQTYELNNKSLDGFKWKPLYYEGFLNKIGDKDVTEARRVNITNRTELNVYDDIFVNVYNNRITDEGIIDILPEEIAVEDYKDYRIVSKLNTRIILPTLAKNLAANGKKATDTTGWGYDKQKEPLEISNIGFKYNNNNELIEADKTETEKIVDYAIKVDNSNTGDGTDHLINFGLIGNSKNIEKDKVYALRFETYTKNNNNIYTLHINEELDRISIRTGWLNADGDYELGTEENKIGFVNLNEAYLYSADDATINDDFYVLFKSNKTIENPFICIRVNKEETFILKEIQLFEAFTRGQDILEDKYLEVRPGEDRETLQLYYSYTGRDITIKPKEKPYIQNKVLNIIKKQNLLLESDVTLGNSYGQQKYFIQEKRNIRTNAFKDTFYDTQKWFEDNDNNFSNTKYVEDDFETNTFALDLERCIHLSGDIRAAAQEECNCEDNKNKICYYKKYGFCPYLFSPELHPRRIRTLQQSKSNRFNLIQELSKVFEVYPTFNIPHDEQGKVTIKDNKIEKYVYFITEKGNDNLLGFRYEKNLSNISRTINSDQITTKLFVDAVDSELSPTGYCTIQTAQDNIGKNSYILDFSYYTKKGLLNAETVEADLYGLNYEGELAFLTKIDSVNSSYDAVQSRISALTDEQLKTLKATNDTNMAGMDAALDEIAKNEKKKALYLQNSNTDNDTYKKYCEKETELKETFFNLIESLFFTDGYYYHLNSDGTGYVSTHQNSVVWFYNIFIKENWADFKKQIEKGLYKICGTIGQQTDMQTQINDLTKVRNSYLKTINALTKEFNQKYEGYLKEGTWTDSNYLTDNEYYWGGVSVLDNSCKPQTNYSISVIDISKTDIKNADLYEIDIADTSYVEDVDFFGIDPYSGLPNKEKVIISEITYNLDIPMNDTIGVQNYTSSFDDLFQQITASVQSLTYNENIYKRARSFTPKHYVKTDSLQGTLNTGDLTLLNTNNSIKLDRNGTEGNAIQNTSNRYILNGDGLYFSTDGGTRWIQAVSPKGYNMDYAKFGAIDVGKIKLVDNQYVYFLWDQNGINAYNPKNTRDYARFNKNGLSLYKDNKIRMRAGYENDNITTDTDIGFYLYDLSGNTIFSTEVNDNDEEYNKSARLNLKGEIFVSSLNYVENKGYNLSSPVTVTKQPTLYYNKIKENNPDNYKGQQNLVGQGNDFFGQKTFNIIQGEIYEISIIDKGMDQDREKRFPSNKDTIDEDFKKGYFSDTTLYINNNSIELKQWEDGVSCFWYYEFKITLKAKINQNNFSFGGEGCTINIAELFDNNHAGTINVSNLLNYFTIQEIKNTTKSNNLYTLNIVSDSNRLNRYFLAQWNMENNENQKEYGQGIQCSTIVDNIQETVSVSTYNVIPTNYIENNQINTIDLYQYNNKYYKSVENNPSMLGEQKSAIYINKTVQDSKEDLTTKRIFMIAILNSNQKPINLISAFNDGKVYIGGEIVDKNNQEITGTNVLENLPADVKIKNNTWKEKYDVLI